MAKWFFSTLFGVILYNSNSAVRLKRPQIQMQNISQLCSLKVHLIIGLHQKLRILDVDHMFEDEYLFKCINFKSLLYQQL